ncbi:MAG: peptidylprolyl isomerase, partial [Ignavibacteriaceae bacterium]|nr:peptidylprolyl isomerase [Ignavibacteriaceae bacterium]
MRFITSVLLLIFVISNCQTAFPQEDLNKIVAKTGSTAISEEEFLQRYEMTPLFRKHIKRITPSLKLEFLYSLIAEKLWALQAKEFGYDTTEVMKFADNELEKMFVRDALYHRDIKDKIKISDEEMIRAYVKNGKKLLVNFLFSTDKNEILNLYEMLNNGVPFDSALAVRPEAAEQSKPVEIQFGQTSEEINDSLYALKIGGYTHPVSTPDGWYIFRMTNIEKQVFSSESDKENASSTVKKALEKYKTKKIYNNYYQKFFKDKKVNVNAPLFQNLVRKIAVVFKEKKTAFRIKDKDPIIFEPNDAIKIEDEFGKDSLSLNYIEFADQPVTLGRFINILSFTEFSAPDCDLMNIAKLLDAKTRKVIEEEYLSREGMKDGLNFTPSVQNDLKMWKESYLSQMLQNKFIDSAKISEKEVYDYYKSNHKNEVYPEQVNIVEVLTGSADTAGI